MNKPEGSETRNSESERSENQARKPRLVRPQAMLQASPVNRPLSQADVAKWLGLR